MPSDPTPLWRRIVNALFRPSRYALVLAAALSIAAVAAHILLDPERSMREGNGYQMWLSQSSDGKRVTLKDDHFDTSDGAALWNVILGYSVQRQPGRTTYECNVAAGWVTFQDGHEAEAGASYRLPVELRALARDVLERHGAAPAEILDMVLAAQERRIVWTRYGRAEVAGRTAAPYLAGGLSLLFLAGGIRRLAGSRRGAAG